MMKTIINVIQKQVLVLPYHFLVRHKIGNTQADVWRSQTVSICGTLKGALGVEPLCLLSVCYVLPLVLELGPRTNFLSALSSNRRDLGRLCICCFQGQMMIIYHFLQLLDTLIEGTSIFYYFFQQCHCFESISVYTVAG